MVQTTEVMPGKDTYEAVLQEVRQLVDSGHAHISICWPKPTSALFMRKRMNHDLQGTFGIRNTTAQELRTLIEDASPGLKKYSSANSLEDLNRLSKVSKSILPNMSPWRTTKIIDETLRICSNVNVQARNYIKSNFQLAQKCIEAYSKLNGSELPTSEKQEYKFDINHIVGTCIVVKNNGHEQDADFLIDMFAQNIAHVFTAKADNLAPQTNQLFIHEDSFHETDALFKDLLGKKPNVDSTVVIVPDSAYKRLVLTQAKKYSIPISGKSNALISDHDLIVCAKTILEAQRDYQNIEPSKFLERFTWLCKPGKNRNAITSQFTKMLKSINSSVHISERFSEIIQLFTSNMSTDQFEENDEETSITQQAFSVLLELSELKEEGTLHDCIYLLARLSEKSLRENKLGEGVYVATPDEILGSYFDFAYVIGLRDRYIPKLQLTPSLIHKDQYLVLGVNDELAASSHIDSSLNWLRNCADNIIFSSSHIDLEGKTTAFPHWITSLQASSTKILFEIDNSTKIKEETYIKNLIGQEYNIPETISATAIETLATCPLKYLYRHELKLQSEYENANLDLIDKMDLGTVVHELLQNYVEKNLTTDQLFEALGEYLNRIFDSGELPNRASIKTNRRSIEKMLLKFLEISSTRQTETIDSEIEVEGIFPIDNKTIKVRGKIDRVEGYSTGKKHLVDYKTGKFHDSNSVNFFQFGKRLQLAVYALLWPDPESVSTLEYWYLAEDTKYTSIYQLQSKDVEELKEMIANILSLLTTGIYLAKPFSTLETTKEIKENQHCSNCEFDGICYQEFRNHWNRLSTDPMFEDYTSVVLGKKA